MKKLVFSIMAIICLGFVGCSDDDDDNQCATCSVDFLGVAITTEACDNGDGTVTVSVNGESEVISAEQLDGQSVAEYLKAIEDGCNTVSN